MILSYFVDEINNFHLIIIELNGLLIIRNQQEIKMKLTVIGSGYVGLVTGTCFADMGNDVWCVDIDEKKIKTIKKGKIPIYEPGLEELIKRNMAEDRLIFTTDLKEGLSESLYIFIAVGTPQNEDGSADLQHVLDAAGSVGKLMDGYKVIINKSTVPIGTSEKVRAVIREELDKRGRADLGFDLVSNPEFLKEGSAIEDFMKPDRIIIGTDNEKTTQLMRELYSPFLRKGDRIFFMDIASSELTKYAANSMLAARISFMNELSRLCELTGGDVEQVRKGIGSDNRIGKSFLYAGIGYGGSCFPKDVKALIQTYHEYGIESKILKAVDHVNNNQRNIFIDKISAHFNNDVKNITFAVWGLSFKPQTDDMRDAPSVDIINGLRERGARFKVYDPVAMEVAKSILGHDSIEFMSHYYDSLKETDALLLLTEWHQFREPDFNRMKSLMKGPVIFDGRNQYDPDKIREKGFIYYCIGRK